MTTRRLSLVSLLAALIFNDCTCNESLSSTRGELGVTLCDRGAACGCEEVPPGAIVDFGSPDVSATAFRTVRLLNENQPRRLLIHGVSLSDASGAFAITGGQVRDSDAADAEAHAFEPADGTALSGAQLAEVFLTFTPSAAGEHTASLTITSDAESNPTWTITLRGGAGASRTCVDADTCGDGSTLDFGVFNDDELSASFDEVKPVTVHNDGDSEIYVAIELTDDGVPETLPGELVGAFGVFSLDDSLGCAVIAPGESLEVPVHYQPFTAGEHHGEVTLHGLGTPVHVPLLGRVIGAHICFRTEDDQPDDVLLRFGAPPSYVTASNAPETRSIWVRNCGYGEDLTVSSVLPAATSSTSYTSPALPWTQTSPLQPVGDTVVPEELEVPVTFTPSAASGQSIAGRYRFTSNDHWRPEAAVDLAATIGQPERCILVPNRDPLDFGWVAEDEAAQGCDPALPFCPGAAGEPKLSRRAQVRLLNAGQRACTDITFGDMQHPNGQSGTFAVEDNPNGEGFTVEPGDVSEPMVILFVSDVSQDDDMFYGKLPYASPDAGAGLEIDMRARAGGSPNCALAFSPVAAASFFCNEESLAFGNVNIGGQRTIDLKLTNVGNQVCNVTDIHPSGTTTGFTFPTADLSIDPAAFAILPVTFNPVPPSGDPIEGIPFLCSQNTILMDVNSGPLGAIEERRVALSGNAVRPDIDVIPGEIDFGDVTVGCCSAERRVAIYNSGDGTLTITQVNVLSSSDPTFSVTQPADMVLDPGESTEMTARFCASSEGAASGVIEILSSDDNEEYFTVSMSGNGTLSSQGNDAFQQPTRPQVDVLFAVDDSGSMSEEQNNLASNFDAFIDTAVELDTDYHLGVITTDVTTEWAGRLYACNGNPKWITDAQPATQQRDQFRCNVKTTQSGRPASDAKEAALQAARLALEYPNLSDGGWNDGFYREAAKLYVIMVTDEHDQSDGVSQLYVDFFRNLKGLGNPDLLNLSAISGPPPDGCATAEPNQLGYDAVTAVGGQFRSICAADWSDLVGSLGLDVFNARQQFPLSRPATADSITVEVCDDSAGTPVSCTPVTLDAADGWTFDGELNAVTFHGGAVPGPGQHVVVEYEAVCYQ